MRPAGLKPRFRYDFGMRPARYKATLQVRLQFIFSSGYDTPGYDLGLRLLALQGELVTTGHEG
jgi:hypothetical protein